MRKERYSTLEEAKENWPEIPWGKCKNIIGKKFNELTVLYRTNSDSNKSSFVCKCSCGKYLRIRKDCIEITESCGHLKGPNLIGKRFGKLVAIRKTEKRNKHGYTIWECKCDCGNICEVASRNLLNEHTQSCGCLRSFGETIMSKILNNNNILFKREYTFEDLKNIRRLRFDFAIFKDNNLQYLIEYDGKQHFYARTKGWNTEEKLKDVHKKDLMKNEYCFKNNIPLIRIPYTVDNIELRDLLLESTDFLLTPNNVDEYYKENGYEEI